MTKSRDRSIATPAMDRAHRLRLAGEALADERTVAAVYSGRAVKSTSRLRVEEAARRLGYALPPAEGSAPPDEDLVVMARNAIDRSKKATERRDKRRGGA